MAPSRTKPPRPPSRSRFQEGSMNDRASAAPPVHFINPDGFLSYDIKPVATATVTATATIRPVSGDFDLPPIPQHEPPPPPQNPPPTLSKRGSKQLFGQVWDGVREKLGMKRSSAALASANVAAAQESSAASTSGAGSGGVQEKKQPPGGEDRPSREEIFANYQQLVASGFFSAHAIQSTRQPAPGTRPSTSTGSHPPITSTNRATATPLWPLPQEPLTPQKDACLKLPESPICSPASASSRGTKRAVDMDDEDLEYGRGGDTLKNHRKIRKTAAVREGSSSLAPAIPRMRSSSRLAAARNPSNAGGPGGSRNVSSQREPNRLAKRVLNKLPLQVPDRASSARRNVSETLGLKRPQQRSSQDGSTPDSANAARYGPARDGAADVTNAGANIRVLRSRRSAAEPLRIRPNANRGIPVVPDIPPKFTYGEDRENDGPWRGLRRKGTASFYNA